MYKANTDAHTQMHKHLHTDKHTLRSSASGFGCPSSNSFCLISSSSSFSRFLSRSSASISFSRSLRRFCSALPLEVKTGIIRLRTIARASSSASAFSDLGHTIINCILRHLHLMFTTANAGSWKFSPRSFAAFLPFYSKESIQYI